MSHTNNKEVERIEEIIENIVAGVAEYPHGRLALAVDLREQLRTILHQELQKVRQTWLEEEIVKLKSEKEQDECLGEERKNCHWCGRNMYCRGRVEEIAHNQTLQTIIDRYQSELDQPITSE